MTPPVRRCGRARAGSSKRRRAISAPVAGRLRPRAVGHGPGQRWTRLTPRRDACPWRDRRRSGAAPWAPGPALSEGRTRHGGVELPRTVAVAAGLAERASVTRSRTSAEDSGGGPAAPDRVRPGVLPPSRRRPGRGSDRSACAGSAGAGPRCSHRPAGAAVEVAARAPARRSTTRERAG